MIVALTQQHEDLVAQLAPLVEGLAPLDSPMPERCRPEPFQRAELHGFTSMILGYQPSVYNHGSGYEAACQCGYTNAQGCLHIQRLLRYVVEVYAEPSSNVVQAWQQWVSVTSAYIAEEERHRAEPLDIVDDAELELVVARATPAPGTGRPVGPSRFSVAPTLVTSRRGGGYRTSRFSLALKDEGVTPQPRNFPSVQELALIALLEGRKPAYSDRMAWYAVRTTLQEKGLLELLRDCRLRLHGDTTLYSLGPDRKASLGFDIAGDGRQQLALRLDGEPAAKVELLKGSRYWYLDLARHQIGLCHGDAAWAAQLRQAPAITRAAAGPVFQAMTRQSGRPVAIPLPQTSRGTETLRVPPVPMLRARVAEGMTFGGLSRPPMYYLELAHRYDRFEVAPGGPAEIYAALGDDRAHLVRDLDAECATAQALRRHFRPVPNDIREPAKIASFGMAALDLHRYADTEVFRHWVPDAQLISNRTAFVARCMALAKAGYPVDLGGLNATVLEGDVDLQAEASELDSRWLSISLGVEVANRKYPLLPILQQWLANPALQAARAEYLTVEVEPNVFVEIAAARLRQLAEPLLEWIESAEPGATSLKARTLAVAAGEQLGPYWKGNDALRQKMLQIRQARKPVVIPDTFVQDPDFVLKPFQLEAVAWASFLAACGLGGILADEMGLGKTADVLAHIAVEKAEGRHTSPTLIVVTTSVQYGWLGGIKRRLPSFRAHHVHHLRTPLMPRDGEGADIVVVTYKQLVERAAEFRSVRWGLVVADEAQALKNQRTQAAQVLRQMDIGRILLVSGTPVENHLGELYAHIDLIEPGLLGRSQKEYNQRYRYPIERNGDPQVRAALAARIAPLILRRTSKEVGLQLPPLTAIEVPVVFDQQQRDLYESMRLAQNTHLRTAIEQRGVAKAQVDILSAITKMRRLCNHPRLTRLEQAEHVPSAKMDALMEHLEDFAAAGKRVLVFSQWVDMLDLVAEELERLGHPFFMLTGTTGGKKRHEFETRFQNGEKQFFLISMKAGGAGLNLFTADTTVLIDRWWNPKVDEQAIKRAHRMGARHHINLYRFLCLDTIEVPIKELQARKEALAEAIYDRGEGTAGSLGIEDINRMFGTAGEVLQSQDVPDFSLPEAA